MNNFMEKTITLNPQQLMIIQQSLNDIFDSCDETTKAAILQIIDKLEQE